MYSKQYLLHTLFALALLASYSPTTYTKPAVAALGVDWQYDFLTTGSLPVVGADKKVVESANGFRALLRGKGIKTMLSADHHTRQSKSFSKNNTDENGEPLPDYSQVMSNDVLVKTWPEHCVQDSDGAKIAIEVFEDDVIFYKGDIDEGDSYSAFFRIKHVTGNENIETGLKDYCKENNIRHLFVDGLALNVCVKDSVLDALLLFGAEMKPHIRLNSCRGVMSREAEVQAIEEMIDAGATFFFVDKEEDRNDITNYWLNALGNKINVVSSDEEYVDSIILQDKKEDKEANAAEEENALLEAIEIEAGNKSRNTQC